MLDQISLVQQRRLPALPEPRPVVKAKMLALSTLIDTPVDLWPSRTGVLPGGCLWLPHSEIVIYGTACRRPLMIDEVREVSLATGLSGIIVRYSDSASERSRISFDVFHNGVWRIRYLLWIDADGRSAWLLPDLGNGPYLLLAQWGVDVRDKAP